MSTSDIPPPTGRINIKVRKNMSTHFCNFTTLTEILWFVVFTLGGFGDHLTYLKIWIFSCNKKNWVQMCEIGVFITVTLIGVLVARENFPLLLGWVGYGRPRLWYLYHRFCLWWFVLPARDLSEILELVCSFELVKMSKSGEDLKLAASKLYYC